MNKKCYVIGTNTNGHLYCNYTTNDLMTLSEALEKLDDILDVDPEAKLLRVAAVEKIDHDIIKRFRGEQLAS